MSSSATTPSVGRILHYYPGFGENVCWMDETQPLPCQIVHVNDDGTVDISLTDQAGRFSFRRRVRIASNRSEVSGARGHCQWMPYQVAASKGEQAPVQHAEHGHTGGHDPAVRG